MGCAYTDDCAGDGVSRADRDTREGRSEQRDGAGSLGAESADGFELGDAGTHGVDDAPSAEICPEGDRGVGGEDDGPVKASPGAFEFGCADDVCAEQSAGNNAHGFLSIIATV